MESVVFEVLIKHGQSGVRSGCLIELVLVGRHCVAHPHLFGADLISCFEVRVLFRAQNRTRRVGQGEKPIAVFLIRSVREEVAFAAAALRMRSFLGAGRLMVNGLHLRFGVVHAWRCLVARRGKHDDRDLLVRMLRVDNRFQLVLHLVHYSLVLRLLWFRDLIALRHYLHFDHYFILPS